MEDTVYFTISFWRNVNVVYNARLVIIPPGGVGVGRERGGNSSTGATARSVLFVCEEREKLFSGVGFFVVFFWGGGGVSRTKHEQTMNGSAL